MYLSISVRCRTIITFKAVERNSISAPFRRVPNGGFITIVSTTRPGHIPDVFNVDTKDKLKKVSSWQKVGSKKIVHKETDEN